MNAFAEQFDVCTHDGTQIPGHWSAAEGGPRGRIHSCKLTGGQCRAYDCPRVAASGNVSLNVNSLPKK